MSALVSGISCIIVMASFEVCAPLAPLYIDLLRASLVVWSWALLPGWLINPSPTLFCTTLVVSSSTLLSPLLDVSSRAPLPQAELVLRNVCDDLTMTIRGSEVRGKVQADPLFEQSQTLP